MTAPKRRSERELKLGALASTAPAAREYGRASSGLDERGGQRGDRLVVVALADRAHRQEARDVEAEDERERLEQEGVARLVERAVDRARDAQGARREALVVLPRPPRAASAAAAARAASGPERSR